MGKIILVLLACIAIANSSKLNYQQRQIYYNEVENVCDHSGFQWMKLAISIDGQTHKQLFTKIHTYCDQGGDLDSQSIVVPTKWNYYDDLNDIKFDEKTSLIHKQGLVTGIIVRTTIRSPAIVDGKEYQCRIIGNGKILHYGSNSGKRYQYPTISIRCNTPRKME